jgi:plastocyanin
MVSCIAHFSSLCAILASLLLFPFRVWAEDIDFNWRITTYQPQTAKVGDTITFNWSGFHNVFIHPSGTCDANGSIEVGTSTGSSYTFTSDDVGEVVFACDVYGGGHCNAGQIVTFNVVPADAPTFLWTIKPYEAQSAKVGDTIIFEWSGSHNVFIHPSGTCDTGGSIEVGSTSGAAYTFTSDDVGEVVFACDIDGGSHCDAGQIVTFNVAADDTPLTTAPTKGPTASPTVSPVKSPTPTPTMKPTAAPTKPPIEIEWFVKQYEPRTANVGDTIVFKWGNDHNVFIHPTGTCDSTGSIEVGSETGTTYTFTEDDVGDVTFACDVSFHCENGQILTFTVYPEDVDAPTMSPATSAGEILKASGQIVSLVVSTLMLSYQLI